MTRSGLRLLLLGSLLASGRVEAAVFTVNSTGEQVDATPGDGACLTGVATCTLRAAIQEANALAGADTINFNIGGGGVQTITLTSALPFISQAVTIDGTTQPLYPGTPIIELSAALGGGFGALDLRGGSSGSTIRGLVINGCPSRAIRLLGTSNNVIAGNFLGTNVAGTAAVANNTGVYIGGSATATNNNRVGGTAPADRNVISGNTADGVQINGGAGGAANNRIEGNYIGLDVSGTLDLGNGGQGVGVFGANANTNNVVGGTALDAGNVISGNGNDGVLIAGALTTGTLVQGNRIGTNAAGSAAIPNLRGVEFDASANGNTIGGTAGGAPNRIAYNGNGGVEFTPTAGTGNAILSNEIYSNGTLGIDLGENGVTLNDPGDGDAGPNGMLNFPDITAATVSGGSVSVSFLLDVPAGSYRIEFFTNPSGADSTGYGEGQAFAGTRNVTHPGGGAVAFAHTLAGASGALITATATFCTDGATCAAFGSTSEWSAVEQVTCCSLSTSEGAGTITVTGAGQFEARFNVATGAGIDQLFDLAEDPARAYDLAGGTGTGKTLHGDGLQVAGIVYNVTQDDQGAKLDLLEATPLRTRVRQEAFYKQEGGTLVLAGIKGFGDYSVYGTGRLALRWNQRPTSGLTYQLHDIDLNVHRQAAAPLNAWTPYSQSDGSFTNPGTDDFFLIKSDVANARTDLLHVISKDWTTGAGYVGTADTTDWFTDGANERGNPYWEDGNTVLIPAASGPFSQLGSEVWSFLTYFKPTTLGSTASPWLDPAATSRSSDYRAPDALAVSVGGPWTDASEYTAGGDDFNESEAAYALTLDPNPGQGLTFQIDGTAANPRYSPFFKIRQWRSFVEAPLVSYDADGAGPGAAVALRKNVDYKAAVKPLSRAHLTDSLRWHCTLDDTSVTNTCSPSGIDLDVGGSGGVAGVTMVPARYGYGASFDSNTDYVSAPSNVITEFDPGSGAIEFWYQPNQGHTASGPLVFWQTSSPDDCFVFEKTGANALRFTIRKGAASNCTSGGTTYQVSVPSGSYSWRAQDWVHLRTSWTNASLGRIAIWMNGVELAFNTGYNSSTVTAGSTVVFGGCSFGCPLGSTGNADGIVDELHLYGGPSEPTSLAHGGRVGAPDEYLADSGSNYPLSLAKVDGSRRGRYLYFGADSKFLGLNVSLATVGTGVADTDVVWQYWRGGSGAWVTLAPTDGTKSFKQTGTVSWADPSGWTPMSVNGGPDLYYVRAHLPVTATADYGAIPTERQIRTDVLLFQYCADVTTAAATFAFAVPPTTEVTLQSFTATAGDASVQLSWRTASELSNLGFHVYRAPSEKGPWARLTSSLIPGLGSSAVGQAYSFRDAGLTNGTRYFYRLEDVDARSKATSHGPVSAVPVAGATGGGPGGESRTSGSQGKRGSPASCPAWVVAAYGSSAGSDAATASLRCTRHGDPETTSLEPVSRDSRSATLELRTGGFYALHEASGTVRVFVPGFDFPQDETAAALPFRRALVDAVVGRRVQLGGVRALELARFEGLVPSALGKAEMQVSRDGTVRAARRRGGGRALEHFQKAELVRLLPSVFQGEAKSAVVEIQPLRFDAPRGRVLLSKRVRFRLLFTGRETLENGRGRFGRREQPDKEPGGELLAQLYTTGRGLHAVAFEDLLPGAARGVAVSELRLGRQGEAVGFHVEPQGERFGPGGRLYFFAERTAGSTEYSSELAYELRRARDGARIEVVSAAPAGGALAPAPLRAASFEVNRFYQPGLLQAEDPWLWEALASGGTRAKSFTLSGVTGSGTAELEVFLQGASESGNPVDHHVSVGVNGVAVGEAQAVGTRPFRVSLSLPGSLLRDGSNELSLTNVADTGVASLVFLDRFVLTHPQASLLSGGRFEGVWSQSGPVSVSGVTGVPAVVDVTGPGAPRWLTGYAASGGMLRFSAEAGRLYLVVSQEGLLAPRVVQPEPSTLRSTTNQADYLLIAPRAFLPAAEPLLRRRADQGLRARAVAFEEIAEAFGHGQPSAEAIRGFLAYAYQSWSRPSPRYVLLLGDSTYDPRNFIGTSQPSPLPALWTRTAYLWTVSDPRLAAVNGDDALPDLAIGRLPAATAGEAQALVQKLLAWEDSGQALAGAAALVADNPDTAGDFEADARDIARSYLSDRSPELLLLSELGPQVRPSILDALNSGLSHLSYVGHGGAAVWASENVWNSWDAASLQAQSQQPLLLTMNCLNGYFVAPAFDSLSESLVKAEGRGAIAAFSPSGLSLDGPAHQYHRALMAELTSGRHDRLGDAILAAQKSYAHSGLMPELLSIYHLLGDPATRIR